MSLRRVSFKQFEGEEKEKEEVEGRRKSESNEPFRCRNHQQNQQIGRRGICNERVKEIIGGGKSEAEKSRRNPTEKQEEEKEEKEKERVEKCDDPISFTFSGKKGSNKKAEEGKGGTNWRKGEIDGTRIVDRIAQPGKEKKELLVRQGDQEERGMLTATRASNEGGGGVGRGVSRKDGKEGESEMDRAIQLDAGLNICSITSSPSHPFTSSTIKGDPHVNEQNGGRVKSDMAKTLTKSVKDGEVMNEEKKEVKGEEKDFDSFYETGSEELDSYLYIDEDDDRDRHQFAKYFDGRNLSFRENREEWRGDCEQEEKCHSLRRVKSCRESGNDRESRIKGRKTLGMLINGPSSPPSSTPSTPPRDRTRSPTVTTERGNNGPTTERVNCGKVKGGNNMMESINYGNGMMSRTENEGGKCECGHQDRSPSSTGTMDRFKSGYAAFRRSFDPRIVTFNCCSPSPPSFTPSPSASDLDSPSLQSNSLPRHSHHPCFQEGSRRNAGCGEDGDGRGSMISSGPSTTSGSLNPNQHVLNRNIRNSQQHQQEQQPQRERNGIKVRRNGEDEDAGEEKRRNGSCKKKGNNLTNSSPTSFSLTSASFSPSLSSSPSDHPSSSMNDSSSSSSSSSTSSSNPKRPSILRKLLSRMGFNRRKRNAGHEIVLNGKRVESAEERKRREKAEAVEQKKREEERRKEIKREEQLRKAEEEERRKLMAKTVNESRFKRSKSLPRNVKIHVKKEVETQTLTMKSASTSCTEINKIMNRSASDLKLVPSNGCTNCPGVNCPSSANCPYNQVRGRTITRTTCCFDKSCSQPPFITSKSVVSRPALTTGSMRSRSPSNPSKALCLVQDRSSQRVTKSNTMASPINHPHDSGYETNQYAQIDSYNPHENLYSAPTTKQRLVPSTISPCSIYCQPLDPSCKDCVNSINRPPDHSRSRLSSVEQPHFATCSMTYYRPMTACSFSTLPSRLPVVPTCHSCKLCPLPPTPVIHCHQDHLHRHKPVNECCNQDPHHHEHKCGTTREHLSGYRSSTVVGTIKEDADAMIHDHHHLPVTTTGTVTAPITSPFHQHHKHYSSAAHRSSADSSFAPYRSSSSNFSSFLYPSSHLHSPSSPHLSSSRPRSPSPCLRSSSSSSSSRIPLPLPPPPPPSSSEEVTRERRTTVSFSPSIDSSSSTVSSSHHFPLLPSFPSPPSHQPCPGHLHRCHEYNNHANHVSPFYRQGSLKLPSTSSYYRTYDTGQMRTLDTANCRRSFAATSRDGYGFKNRPDIANIQDTPWTPASCKQCNLNKSIINSKINTSNSSTTTTNSIMASRNGNHHQNGQQKNGSHFPSRHPPLPSPHQPLLLPSPSTKTSAVSFQSKSTTSNEYSSVKDGTATSSGGIERDQEVKK